MSIIQFLTTTLAFIALVKIILHNYLNATSSNEVLNNIFSFQSRIRMFTSLYKEEETGWRNILKSICNISFFLVVFLFCMTLLAHFLAVLIREGPKSNR